MRVHAMRGIGLDSCGHNRLVVFAGRVLPTQAAMPVLAWLLVSSPENVGWHPARRPPHAPRRSY